MYIRTLSATIPRQAAVVKLQRRIGCTYMGDVKGDEVDEENLAVWADVHEHITRDLTQYVYVYMLCKLCCIWC